MITTATIPATTLAVLGLPGGWEWIVILAIGLLLFGRRLPEVGRSLGKSIVEFKKGIKGIEEEINEASDEPRKKPELPDEQRTVARTDTSVPAQSEPPTPPPPSSQQSTA